MKQAVIIAGGYGSRVLPITNYIPKPLIPINGVPILKLILDQLDILNLEQVTILAGYKADFIESYCDSIQNNYSFRIDVEVTPEEFSPAERILKMSSPVAEDVLFLYCDNYVSDNLPISKVLNSDKELTLLVQKRDVGNVKIADEYRAYYFASNRSETNPYVELGYFKAKYDSLIRILRIVNDLPTALEIMSHTYLTGYVSIDSGYISISNLQRFLNLHRNHKYLLLDRDGVVNKNMGHREYVLKSEDFKFIDKNLETLQKLGEAGFYFIIVTNQPAVGLGLLDLMDLQKIHENMVRKLYSLGIFVLNVYSCVHHWDENCNCRKPKSGMIIQALHEFELNPKQTLLIGDEPRDLVAAENAGVEGILISNKESTFVDLSDAFASISQYFSSKM
jgi:histidinol-phosphate phosphatase family protein